MMKRRYVRLAREIYKTFTRAYEMRMVNLPHSRGVDRVAMDVSEVGQSEAVGELIHVPREPAHAGAGHRNTHDAKDNTRFNSIPRSRLNRYRCVSFRSRLSNVDQSL